MARGPSKRERSAFGQRLLEARTQAGLDQVAVAAALGISQGTLSELETSSNGSALTAQLARLYGCDATWLATGEGPMHAPEPWPFQMVDRARFEALTPQMRGYVENAMNHAISECEDTTPNGRPSYARQHRAPHTARRKNT